MNISTILLFMTFVISNETIFNLLKDNITMKIKERDYFVFNYEKNYIKINIYLWEVREHISFTFEDLLYDENNKYISISLNVNYVDKSIKDITEEIESKLIEIFKTPNNNSFVLLYYASQYEKYPIIKEIIESIQKDNHERRVSPRINQIFYENICANCMSINKIFADIKKYNYNKNGKIDIHKSHTHYIKKDDAYYFNLYLVIDKILYFFMLNTKEIEESMEIKTENMYEMNLEIFYVLSKLYKIVDIEYLNTRFCSKNLDCYLDKIELVSKGTFKIEIGPNYIRFHENLYNFENKSNRNKNFYSKFQKKIKIIKYIKDIDADNVVESLYRLFFRYNKVEFLILGLLNRPKSPLKLIFAYLLLFIKAIEKEDFDIITGINEYTENIIEIDKNELTKKLLDYLLSFNDSESYLMKILLILEAEEFLNENDVTDEPILKSLKYINDHLKTKNYENEYIDIIDILKEIKTHIGRIIEHKKDILDYINKINMLFTESISTTLISEKGKEHYTKDEIITNLCLNEFEVEKSIRFIKKNIFENIEEDRKYEQKRNLKAFERQRIDQIILLTTIYDELNKIMSDALNTYNELFFDEEVVNNFIKILNNEVIKVIDMKFNEYPMKKEIQEDSILEYKKELETIYLKRLRENINKNILNNAMEYALQTLTIIFDNKYQNISVEESKYEKCLKNMRLILKENALFEALNDNSGIKLHDNLIRILNS
ncbi:uncharacterized protein VNE69_02220 [Vairimorpha necatrix]|uniref:Uncharacterized protein n=2 Tax=Vairimorpha necatrix TaxID=6039 RepID=A0AAX4J9M5_9MICR